MKLRKFLLILLLSQITLLNIAKAEVTDIAGHWAEPIINQWIQQGYVQGNEKGRFNPDDKITRAEMVALVNKVAFNNINAPEGFSIYFSDVPDFEWYYGHITKAKYCGYINGYPDGTFRPNDPITREQAVSIAGIIYGIKSTESEYTYLNQFSDAYSANIVAKPYLNEFIKLGYIKGYDDSNELKPASQMTRAEAVVLFNKLLDKEIKLHITEGKVTDGQIATQIIINQNPPKISFEYYTEPVNTMVTVDVKIEHNQEIRAVKWLRGLWNAQSVNEKGQDITETRSFDVLENDIYTVYVEDIYSNYNINFVPISNIDTELLNTKLNYNLSVTNEGVLIKVEQKGDRKLKVIKWISGEQKLEAFDNGGEHITDTKEINITENGVYTIFVLDEKNNKDIKIITINSIDKESPTIAFSNNSSAFDKAVIDIIAQDNIKLAELKYLAGEKTIADFAESGEDILLSRKIVSDQNGKYTVYAKDTAGNKVITIVDISNIDTSAPYICYKNIITNTYNKIEELTNSEIEGIYIVDDVSKVNNAKVGLLDADISTYKTFAPNSEGIVFIAMSEFEPDKTYKVVMEDNAGFIAEAKMKLDGVTI